MQNTIVRRGNGVKVSILWIQHRSVAVEYTNTPITLTDKCDPTGSNLYMSTILVFIYAPLLEQKVPLRNILALKHLRNTHDAMFYIISTEYIKHVVTTLHGTATVYLVMQQHGRDSRRS